MKPRLTLRVQLALVSLVLLALPWLGYRYVQEMERFLLESQQQALLATARATAALLHEKPQLMHLTTPARSFTTDIDNDPLLVELGRVDEARHHREVSDLLKGMERSGARIWVINRELKVLSVAGTLKKSADHAEPGSALDRLIALIIAPPTQDFDDAIDSDVLIRGKEIDAALLGAPTSRLRNTPDGRAVIASAAHPVWSGSNVVGAVIAEETTHPVLALRNQALARLLGISLVALAVIALVVLGFATWLSSRIRRLRDEAEGALDARGRIAGLVTASRANDEIGDLSRSFSTMLERLAQHHDYLQSLASRLSHELRTPVAVVRSSLENLRLAELDESQRVYVERADEGIVRLNRILSRMTEATRLESSLADQERELFDLGKVLHDCVAGYRLAYADTTIELLTVDSPVMIAGSPDLLAQLLDKLIGNAREFRTAGTPIRVQLSRQGDMAVIHVENSGTPIPDSILGKLFGSMVSSRRESSTASEPHLGLGLYIARLVTEFHGGRITADNIPGGVRIAINLPISGLRK